MSKLNKKGTLFITELYMKGTLILWPWPQDFGGSFYV